MTWLARAACRWWPPDWWFPISNGDSTTRRLALQICNECPVARECLIEAMRLESGPDATHTRGYRHGIWGGTTARQRQRLAITWKETDGEDGELHG